MTDTNLNLFVMVCTLVLSDHIECNLQRNKYTHTGKYDI